MRYQKPRQQRALPLIYLLLYIMKTNKEKKMKKEDIIINAQTLDLNVQFVETLPVQ